jgi:hypothetical protein
MVIWFSTSAQLEFSAESTAQKFLWKNYGLSEAQITFGGGSERYPTQPLRVRDGDPDDYSDAYRALQKMFTNEDYTADNSIDYQQFKKQMFFVVIDMSVFEPNVYSIAPVCQKLSMSLHISIDLGGREY